jgi:LuxR family transcriptional regulator, maltose regulon positive regulatory protein
MLDLHPMIGHRAPKLVAPRATRIVRRARVLTALDRALKAGICWVAAPAGYGKTTAVVDYLQKRRLAHLWYRADEGDQDIASFFHYLASALPRPSASLPVFGAEYSEQPKEFARRFARAYFTRLKPGTVLVLDDLHYADTPQFRAILAILLRELPESLKCLCVSRTLPPDELSELTFNGRLRLVDQPILQFSDREATALVATRVRRQAADVDVSFARGWAAGLVLMADRAAAGTLRPDTPRGRVAPRVSASQQTDVFAALARQLFDALPPTEQEALLKLSLLPEVTPELAAALAGKEVARNLLGQLHQRQLLITRAESARSVFQLHDLFREFLQNRLASHFPATELAALRERAAVLLDQADDADSAIALALEARAWPLARAFLTTHAERLLGQGRRATLIDWCSLLPSEELDAWLCYWLGVANMADDAAAEGWLSRAWSLFSEQNVLGGQCLTAARAVLAKTDSWRTHEGLAAWTQRVIDLIDRDIPSLSAKDELLAWAGMLRAVDYASDYRSDGPAVERLRQRLLQRLAKPAADDTPTLRVIASQTLIEHAGSAGNADIFERAVDSVSDDLRRRDVLPWALGMWLVAFGSVTSRYFHYSRRGFPYSSPEHALRAAMELGERETLRGVEFGALYHLQLLMKMRNDWSEFGALIQRISHIADSRFTTQVAVAADCEAALQTRQRRFSQAYLACDRFMAAIEAANEPPIERWPHFITRFQVLLADRKCAEAATFLRGLVHLFDGAVRQRTELCVHMAEAFDMKWKGSANYPAQLRLCMQELRSSEWIAALINVPDLAAELCADALELGIETDFALVWIARRSLTPPSGRPSSWPWRLRVRVLGELQVERDGAPVSLGAKPPTRSLDILRALAISKGQTCPVDDLCEWLWPDADGDQARAACEQAVHRLRKLLGITDVVVQREGKLRLAPELVWVDLASWEQALSRALRPDAPADESTRAMTRVFEAFTGPLFRLERPSPWALPASERLRSKFLDLCNRLAGRYESHGDYLAARAVHLRALDMYPTAARCYEALIRGRLAQNDRAGALEDYHRYARMLDSALDTTPSPAIRALIAPLLSA